MGNTQELVTIIPWTFIAQILNLFIQMYLIKRFLFKPINDVLEKRRDLADKEIREAREAKEEADGLKVQYEEGLANARTEAAQIVSNAQKEAQLKSVITGVFHAEQAILEIYLLAACPLQDSLETCLVVVLFDMRIPFFVHVLNKNGCIKCLFGDVDADVIGFFHTFAMILFMG